MSNRIGSKRTCLALLTLAVVGGGAPLVCAQSELRVPAQHPTIQAAINAASNGDVVLLADGTHTGPGNRDLTVAGKTLTVRSETGDRAVCVVDCNGVGRFALFGAGDVVAIQNLSIRNGRAPAINNNGGAARLNAGSTVSFENCILEDCTALYFGGAIATFGADLTLDGCVIQGNQGQSGGGVWVQGGSATVGGCTFNDNYATGAGGGLRVTGGARLTCSRSSFTANRAWVGGGGLFVQSINPDSTVMGCVFRDNEAGLSGDGAGGGFACDTGAGLRELSDCVFEGNIAHTSGAALFRGTSTTRVERVLFLNNEAQDTPSFVADGGAIRVEPGNAPDFVRCAFIGNSATYGGGVEVNGAPTFTNCLFSGNRATGLPENHPAGGALDVFGDGAAPIVNNCTFAGNTSEDSGGATTVSANAQLTLLNCVMWADNAPNGPEIRIGWGIAPNGIVNVAYSDVARGEAGVQILSTGILNWGAGNIDADPLFVDADGADDLPGSADDDLRISAGSPCTDAGDRAFHPDPCEKDHDGACRVWDGDADSLAAVDMGAYELGAARGDVDGDCRIGLSDLAALLAHFGVVAEPARADGDIDFDGDVDLSDLSALLANFGATCP